VRVALRPDAAASASVRAAGKDMAVGALLVVTLLSAFSISSQIPVPSFDDSIRLTRVKAADKETRRLVLDGARRSTVFRALIDELHQFNVIVVIQFGFCANGRIRSCVSNVDGDERQRHIRVKVSPRTTEMYLIATIAHELQHALEIAREPRATNVREVLELYRRIATGKCREGLSEECETDAALEVETRVHRELASTR
jgi:hypothetical protein